MTRYKMYEAINNYVIVKEDKTEITSDSGIILNDKKPEYTVVATTEETKELMGRKVLFENPVPLEGGHYSIDIKNIVAVVL